MIESVRRHRKHSFQKGMTYGRLTLTGKTFLQAMYGQQRRMVEADCICGVTRFYLFDLLSKGDTKSCGCLRNELISKLGKAKLIHGMKKHPLYLVWKGMKGRRYGKNNIGYAHYGGRGIGICEEWLEKPKTFFDWAIENGWQQGLEIDRINNDGDYGPENCRFVPPSVNGKNRRSNRWITAFGETKCLTDWAKDERCKVSFKRLWVRLKESRWKSTEEMITTPPIEMKEAARRSKVVRMITAFGETKCLAAWLEDERCKVKSAALRKRLRKGWSAEAAISEEICSGNFKINKDRNTRLSDQPANKVGHHL